MPLSSVAMAWMILLNLVWTKRYCGGILLTLVGGRLTRTNAARSACNGARICPHSRSSEAVSLRCSIVWGFCPSSSCA
eukprot:1333771-Rhodomonas_salina.1